MTDILAVSVFEEMVKNTEKELIEALDRSHKETTSIIVNAFSKCTNDFEEQVLTERLKEVVTEWRISNELD